MNVFRQESTRHEYLSAKKIDKIYTIFAQRNMLKLLICVPDRIPKNLRTAIILALVEFFFTRFA